jgi:hypothetical protein
MLLAFVETPQRHGSLTIFPVVAADEPELSYLLATDALQRGVLTIEEDGGGNSPYFIARNVGSDPVLILDCEAVQGVGEHRSTAQSILLGPESVTRVPVSCVEAGKWSCGDHQGKLSKSLEKFPLLDGQVGILAFLGRQLLGLDALGSPELYSPLHRRLMTVYLSTALAAGKKARPESSAADAEIRALAEALEGAARVTAPCHGHGEYSTIQGQVTGGELRHNGHLVHLSVFPNGVAA